MSAVADAAPRTRVHEAGAAGEWSFGGTWPYEARWLETDGVRLHYVDEGPRDGEPVLLLHGSPTWAYLYRRYLRGLADGGYRAVAYDQLGFGRSDKPARGREYSLERHGRHLEALAGELELDGVTLVLHDWGGPLGLAWAARHADRVRRLVLLNTFSEEAPGARGPYRWPLTRELLVKGAHVYVRGFLLRAGLRHPERLGEHERAAYLAPHRSWSSRAGILAAARFRASLPDLEPLHGKPVLYLWGLRDRALGEAALRRWQERLPGGAVELEDSASFVPEDAPEESLAALLEFLRRMP
ncbi:MAG TPA: alpha/beta fold hydrolase [Gaiellaceae bacterium]|nr:alpha/beta fold hydrolase [Gaiellaceae bacterium]